MGRENHITYHEWGQHLRNAVLIDRSAGHLERVSQQSGIPLTRLEGWLAKRLSLSHAEFISLHEVLAETHHLGHEETEAAVIEEREARVARIVERSSSEPFDESD